MILRSLVLAACLGLFATPAANANYLITVGNISISPGTTGYLPVYIAGGVSQGLASTSLEFRITTGGSTRLEFLSSPAPALDPTFTDVNYVFFGNSLDETFDLPLGTASLSVVPNDTFIGGDATSDFSDVPVATSDLLLAWLPITTLTAVPPVAGDTFTISLVPVSASGLDGNTGFADSSGEYATFSSQPGTVTVVPEPSSWLLAILGIVNLVPLVRRAKIGHRTSATHCTRLH